jgi:hypothetical protein
MQITRLGNLRLEPDGHRQQTLGVGEPSALQVDQAEPVERFEMLRIIADNVAVEACGLHELTRLVET